MTLFHALRDANRSNWTDALSWLLYNLVGSLAPVYIGYFLVKLFSRDLSWVGFSQQGQFALYSAAMFAPAFYTITRDLKVPGFAGRQPLALCASFGMLIATCLYVGVTAASMAPQPVFQINQGFLRISTFVLFSISAILAFLVTVLDNARLQPDVREIAAAERQDLEQDFDKLGGAK